MEKETDDCGLVITDLKRDFVLLLSYVERETLDNNADRDMA